MSEWIYTLSCSCRHSLKQLKTIIQIKNIKKRYLQRKYIDNKDLHAAKASFSNEIWKWNCVETEFLIIIIKIDKKYLRKWKITGWNFCYFLPAMSKINLKEISEKIYQTMERERHALSVQYISLSQLFVSFCGFFFIVLRNNFGNDKITRHMSVQKKLNQFSRFSVNFVLFRKSKMFPWKKLLSLSFIKYIFPIIMVYVRMNAKEKCTYKENNGRVKKYK